MPGPQSYVTSRPPSPDLPVLRALAQHWWLLLLRGIAAVAFGILAFIWPGLTLITLTVLWGAYALADGIFALWAASSGTWSGPGSRLWLGIVGMAGILAGSMAFFSPTASAIGLLWFIAGWAIVIGAMQILGAIQLRKEMQGEWLLAVNGILSIVFGVMLMVLPAVGALAVVWLIGSYAIATGCAFIVLGLRLSRSDRSEYGKS